MCGIFGYIGKNNIDIKAATDIIEHRGPDSEGFLKYLIDEQRMATSPVEGDGHHVSFGFRRLAIIDLKEHANQPFSSENAQYHIVFNGEIYNYLEIRQELEELGVEFSTDSDTEVLLKSYVQWGVSSFNRFNGMWAFSILDLKKNKVICSRDRFGIKPFFYHVADGELYWASEIKQFFSVGVEKAINENVIKDFIDQNIVNSTNETFFDNIYSLNAGSYFEIDLSALDDIKVVPKKYWELSVNEEYENYDYESAKKKFKNLFLSSVNLRMRSDVRVGSCLSGGLDSSSIVSSVAHQFEDQNFQTFTSKFDIKKYDESSYVHALTKKYEKLQSSFCQLNEDKFLTQIDDVIYYQDEPFGTMSLLAQWEVMKLAKQDKTTVLLDGQGGDELLAGYRKFYAFYLKEKLASFQLLKFLIALKHLIFNREFNFFDLEQIKRYLNIKPSISYYSSRGEKLKSNSEIGLGAANSMRERSKLDVERYSFPPLLRFEDRNSMAFSIETRVPFMDYRLVEFLYSISSDYKIKKGYTKWILRDALEGILPEKIRKRKSKLGFSTPQDVWMKNKLKPFFAQYFETMRNPYFDAVSISKSFEKFPHNKIPSNFYFRVYCFDRWYQMHFNLSNTKEIS